FLSRGSIIIFMISKGPLMRKQEVTVTKFATDNIRTKLFAKNRDSSDQATFFQSSTVQF
ncbi:Uncharacterized protein DAT39_015246, partial [Clarias magur]